MCRSHNCKKLYYCEFCQFVCFCEEEFTLHHALNHVMQVQAGGGAAKRKAYDDEPPSSSEQSDHHHSRSRDRVVRPRQRSPPPALSTFTRVRSRKSFKDLIW